MTHIESLHRALYRWYEQYHRVLPWRETDDPYKIWLSEIILQQTRVVQGMEYYLRFTERFPDVATLAAADEDEVLRYWQGLGYYSRARNLHKAAKMIIAQGWLPFPTSFEQIRQLPGVGDYTAGAIASFAYNRPYPAMDGNVYRVVARLYDCDIAFDTNAGKKHFHHLIDTLLDQDNPRLFNSAIMEFGALYCTPSLTLLGSEEPSCPRCPLAMFCLADQHHTAALLPVRKPRPTLRDRYLNYFIYLCPTDTVASKTPLGPNSLPTTTAVPTYRTLLHKRTDKDIWQHLYEFPLIETDHLFDTAEAIQALHTAAQPISAVQDTVQDTTESTTKDTTIDTTEGIIQTSNIPVLDFTHILSHQRLHARFFCVQVPILPTIGDAIGVSLSDLDRYALSRLTLRALEKLQLLP